MTVLLPAPIRSIGRRILRRCHTFHDLSRGKFREYVDRYKILRGATLVVQDVYGTRFVLYPFDRQNSRTLLRRPYDTSEFELIPKLVKPGDTAIDVGANAGLYSVLLSRACGPTGRVWSFEPAPETYWRLRENLALNRCENVVTVEAAVSNAPGTAKLHLFDSQFAEWNSLGVRVARDSNGKQVSPARSIGVQAEALDIFCANEGIEHIHFLKIDVEGFELLVFEGAKRLLIERRIDYVCFEIGKELLEAAGSSIQEVIGALAASGYLTYRFNSITHRFEGPILDTFEPWANFFASHRNLSSMTNLNTFRQDLILQDEAHKAALK
jgi:FkbM family methyltransferase